MDREHHDSIIALTNFFAAFRANYSLGDEPQRNTGSLERFFGEFSTLRTLLDPQPAPRPPVIEIDLNSLATFFAGFGHNFRKSRQDGDFIDVWEVAGLKRSELRNAAVFAWLLDPNQTHGRGSKVLDVFIRRLAEKHQEQISVPKKVGINYFVFTEAYLLNSMESWVDIVIDGPDFIVIIEIKIDAPEGDKQVERYLALAKAKAISRPYWVIFLSPRREQEISSDPHFVAATWNDVAGAIEEVVKSNSTNFVSFSDRLLLQFAQRVRSF